jgi:acyl-CoA hydrolase
VPQIPSGATLQLGIGGMPNVIGKMLADSDLRDLGMHTELCSDAYVDLWPRPESSPTRADAIHPGKGVLGHGSSAPSELYDWL